MKCEDTIYISNRLSFGGYGDYVPCEKKAKWLITSNKAFADKPFKRKVCTYHKNKLIKKFNKINVKYSVSTLDK